MHQVNKRRCFWYLRELNGSNDGDENVGNGRRGDESIKRINMTYTINIEYFLQEVRILCKLDEIDLLLVGVNGRKATTNKPAVEQTVGNEKIERRKGVNQGKMGMQGSGEKKTHKKT